MKISLLRLSLAAGLLAIGLTASSAAEAPVFTPEQIAAAVVGYPTTPIPATYFGLHYTSRSNPTWPSSDIFGDNGTSQIKFGELRIWDTGASWGELNAGGPGVYDWTKLDVILDFAAAHNLDVVYCFGHTPYWAVDHFYCGSIDNKGKAHPVPATIDWSTYDNFITAIVTHAKGRIKYWEVWNEPDGKLFFNGTMADVATMARHVREKVHAIQPQITIIGPSTQGWESPVYDHLAAFLAAGGGAHVDKISFHGRLNPSFNGGNAHAENIFTLVAGLRAKTGKAEVFDTEWGWAPKQIPDPIDQANYVARQFLCRWSLGLKNNDWYSMVSNNWGGLWKPTNGLNPAGVAYAQVYKWMVGATMSSPVTLQANKTWTVGFTRSGGYESLAVWNTGTVTTYTPDKKYIHYRDLAGNRFPVLGAVTIGASPILLETMTAVSKP
jgi:hypothetical protein